MTPRRNPTTEGYDRIAAEFESARRSKVWELRFFEALAGALNSGDRLLDCGCGNGHPGLDHLIRKGIDITGLDGSTKMLAIFRTRYPNVPTVLCDMLDFHPLERFDALVAWDSFFHLSHDDQRQMTKRFGEWLKPGGRLLFTSGPDHSIVDGQMFGVPFAYASFDDDGYRALLTESGFVEIHSEFDEPSEKIHKVWRARRADGEV